MLEMSVEGAKSIDLGRRKFCGDFGLSFDVFRECPLTFSSFHRGALDSFISSFSVRARAGEREQDRLTEVKAFCQR